MAGDGRSSMRIQTELIDLQGRLAGRHCWLMLSGVVLMVLQNQIALGTNGGIRVPLIEAVWPVNVIRMVCTLTTLLTMYTAQQHYFAEVALLQEKNLLPRDVSLWSSRLRGKLLVEWLILVVHPFPFIDRLGSVNWLLFACLGMFARVIFVERVMRYSSAMLKPQGRFIGALTNVDFDTSFVLKSMLKDHGPRLVASLLIGLLLSAGYALFIIESVVCAHSDSVDVALCFNPDTKEGMRFMDALWLLVITILTVGYGDVVPKTHGGRFVAIAGGLMGTLLTAVIIALVTESLHLTRSESKVISFLRKDQNRKQLRNNAARALQGFFRYSVAMGRSKSFKGDANVGRAQRSLYDRLSDFRRIKRYTMAYDGADPTDKQLTLLETMDVNIDDVKTKVEAIEERICGGEEGAAGGAGAAGDAAAGAGDETPLWATQLEASLKGIVGRVEQLNEELGTMRTAIDKNIAETNERLERVERASTGST